MTEPSYGGSNGLSKGKIANAKQSHTSTTMVKTRVSEESDYSDISKKDIDNYEKAGKIAKQVKEYAKSVIKSGTSLLDIAEKIENKIIELGGKPAFPCNLSIDDTAAHYTPSWNDQATAKGLIKIDFGVHVSGCIVDTAFSIDLESNEENRKLIMASEKALEKAIEQAKNKRPISEIGKSIHEEITKHNFSPVRNLSGHSLSSYTIHSGITIPNYDNGNKIILESGAYAIEPFATSGNGIVYDSSLSGIYRLEKEAGVRDSLAREILAYVKEEYRTLPFCSRWIVKKFGARCLISLKFLENAGIIYQYPQLIEQGHGKVSQSENTILITENKVEVLT